jgi:hypothetical protein
MKRVTLAILILGLSGFQISVASANESPNWLASKPNSFTLQTSSDLNSRGTISVKGVIPPKDTQYDEAVYKQQTSGGTRTGFCSWTLKDTSYPGYLDQGGIGIVVLGQQLSKEKINSDSFSMRGVRYTGYMSQSPNDYSDMYITSMYGTKDAVNINGTDLLFASSEFRNNRSASQYFLKEFTASFSTTNWDAGTYQIMAVYNDGCSQVHTSAPLTLQLNPIPAPKWKCETKTKILSNESASFVCNSDISVNLLPFHLEIFENGDWEDLFHGTANGKSISIQNMKIPVGKNSLRLRTDELENQYLGSISSEMNVEVLPAPYTVKCSAPTAVRANEYLEVSCLSSGNINGAFTHLQSFSNGKWVNVMDSEWVDDNVRFSNISYSKAGTSTLRVVTDAESGKYLGYTSASLTIKVSAPKTTSSGGNSSGGSGNSGAPSGKVDKTSNAYKTMFNVGKNFAKVSLANDTAASQCGSARNSGLIRAGGVPQYLGVQARMIQSYLNTASGWRGCIDGFGH